MNIIEQYYPIEKNKSGAYKDFHLLQEVYYNTGKGDRFGLNAWYINSNRELPMLTVDHGEATDFDNRQREQTFRGVLSWDHLDNGWKVGAKGGYIYTWMAYDYKRDVGNGNMAHMTQSRSEINTIYGQGDGEYYIGKEWLFTASLSAHQHFVESRDKNIIRQDGNKAVVGYEMARIELSGSISAKWRPTDRFGLSAVIREELFGNTLTPIIPALFVDGVISKKGNVVAKASISRNYRFPTLNDIYFHRISSSIVDGDIIREIMHERCGLSYVFKTVSKHFCLFLRFIRNKNIQSFSENHRRQCRTQFLACL